MKPNGQRIPGIRWRWNRGCDAPSQDRGRSTLAAEATMASLSTFATRRRSHSPPVRRFSAQSAFTMVEIAIALAVIGFALVAIIGILPIGINVQRENREETIINQDASVLINAIRNGERGLDDLTNYVVVITNNVWRFFTHTNPPFPSTPPDAVSWYTFNTASYRGTAADALRLTNGLRIIGLLSTPKYVRTGNEVEINQIIANIRALSGGAIDKVPQTNEAVRNLGLNYRFISELSPLPQIETNTLYSRTYDTNAHEMRLVFRWPLLPNGQVGNGRQVFRTVVSGRLLQANNGVMTNLYFLSPTTFTMVQ